MNKRDDSDSSNDEETYQDYFTNPQKRKQFDSQRLYQQQKELQKMSGFNKHLVIEPPKRIQEPDNQKNYATVSLFCLTVTNPFRDKMIRIVLNPWFDRFILITIVANCVFLAIDDPNEDQLPYQVISDLVFLIIFTLEMCFKIVAIGFALRPYSYLRDTWNILDFIVVIMGWISKVVSSNNVSAIRVIRILRPLRTINSMPGMRRLVQSLFNSLPTMLDIFILFSFFVIMFGTITTQLFGGTLQWRCVNEEGEIQTGDDGNDYFCGNDFYCPEDTWTCQRIGNPDYEVTSFDNILKSALNIFIIITLEGWSDTMYKIRSATGTVAYDIVFILIIFLGCFFILNLMVAVQFSYLNQQFEDQKNRDLMIKQKEEAALIKYKEETPASPLKNNKEQQMDEQTKFNDGFSKAVVSDKDKANGLSEKVENEENIQGDNQFDSLTQQLPNNQNSVDNIPEFQVNNGPLEVQKKNKAKQILTGCQRFQRKVFLLIDSKSFNLAIIVLIMINTIFMALEHYDQPDTLTEATNLGNSILTCIFAVEMILKMIGLGLKQYVMDGFNDFDAIIVIVGMLEFVSAGSKALTVLRAFRLLRIFKIVKSWTTLKNLLQTVLNAISSIANLGLLMFLLVFIYALIGMQFLSGPIPDNESGDFRFHFNTFTQSMITMFVLLTGENWNSILIQFVDKDGFGASIFFVSMIITGNILMLNLFVAILLNFISENLEQEDLMSDASETNGQEKKDEIVEEQFDYIQERLRIRSGIKSVGGATSAVEASSSNKPGQGPQSIGSSAIYKKPYLRGASIGDDQSNNNVRVEDISIKLNLNNDEHKISEESNEDTKNNRKRTQQIDSIQRQRSKTEMVKADNKISNNAQNKDNSLKSADINQENQLVEYNLTQQKDDGSIENQQKAGELNKSLTNPESADDAASLKKRIKKTFRKKAQSAVLNITGRSLFIFSQKSRLRKILKSILTHSYFEGFIFHLIGLNSLTLALDEPQLTDPYQKNTLSLLQNIISVIFIVEAVAKIIVLGFFIGKNTYLRDSWNILDGVIVSFSILNWVLDGVSGISVSFLRGFRALRALRPLRMVSKNEGMKVVVNSLLTAIPGLLNVILISLLFFLVFGILGVQLFKGQLGYCNDVSISYKGDCHGWFQDDQGEWTWRYWIVPFNNYDNIFYSMCTFFEVASGENWPEVLFRTIDSQDFDMGPSRDNRPVVALLFVIYIFITSFFVMNLFDSVIVDKFTEEIKKKEGSHKFSEEQKEWVKIQRIMLHVNLKIQPICPKNRFRRVFFYIAISKQFELFISFIIMVNTLFLCMDYVDDPADYNRAIEIGNIIFVSIFAAEALIKMLGHGVKFYFLETWNKFDFVIVILSMVALDDSLFSFKVNALRIIRVARLLRMIKASKGLRHLLKTLWLAMGNIANVGTLLFLIFFTFSVAGMDLFQSVPTGNYFSEKNSNFQSFYITFTLLFRCSTGENWNGLMHDCYNAVGLIAVIYWIAFTLLTHYIFINIFVAVIFESFNDVKASEDENDVLSIKRKDIKAFVRTWAQFCPNGEHYMPTTEFANFLRKLPPPLGYEGQKIENAKLNKIIFCLNIKSHLRDNEGKVYFPEVMWTIFHSIIGNNDVQVHSCEQVVNIMRELKRKYKGLGKYVTPDSLCGNKYYRTEMTVSKYMCALAIYKNWKRYKTIRDRRKELMQNQQSNQNVDGQIPPFNDQDSQLGNENNRDMKNSMGDQMKISDNSDSHLLNNDMNNNNNIGSLRLKIGSSDLQTANFDGLRKMKTQNDNEIYRQQSKNANNLMNATNLVNDNTQNDVSNNYNLHSSRSVTSKEFNKNQFYGQDSPEKDRILNQTSKGAQPGNKMQDSKPSEEVGNPSGQFLLNPNNQSSSNQTERHIDNRNYLRSFGHDGQQFVSHAPASQGIILNQEGEDQPEVRENQSQENAVAIDAALASSFKTEEFSEDMNAQERENKVRYLDFAGENNDDIDMQDQNENRPHSNANKKKVMIDFAMIKGYMNLVDFLKEKQDEEVKDTSNNNINRKQNHQSIEEDDNEDSYDSQDSEETVKNHSQFKDLRKNQILQKARVLQQQQQQQQQNKQRSNKKKRAKQH